MYLTHILRACMHLYMYVRHLEDITSAIASAQQPIWTFPPDPHLPLLIDNGPSTFISS